MRLPKNIQKLIEYPKINFELVESLYVLSERSLTLLGALSLFISYILYPVFGWKIILWNLLLIMFLGYRLYMAMLFKKDSDKYTLTKWYKLFTTSALFTASLFGLIGITAIPLDNTIGHHLMITAFLMGLSAASNTSLGKDSRLDTIYSTILIAPLVIGMMLENTQIYWLTSILILFAYGSKLVISIHNLKLQEQINKQKERINRVRQTLKEKENLMYHFTQEAPIAILSYNKDLKITDANNALLKLFKLKRHEILGLSALSVPDKRIVQTMQKSIETGSGIYQGPYRSLKNLDLWVEAICFSIKDQNEIVTGGICVIHDKTNEHNALKILEFNSKHDQLTLLQNRRGLYAEMSNILQHEKHHAHYSVLFYLDLNKFKYINDSLGHKTGDTTLVAVANRLSLELPDNSIISRFGGDEFIIIAPYVVNKKALIDQPVQLIINKLKTIFSEPFMINDIKLTVQTSVGIVIIEPKDSNVEEIIRHADIAMYQAKKNRHNHISYYDIELDNERKKLFTLQHDLVFAAENRQLELYLQPIVSIDNDHLIAAECLIRWEHPKFGLLSPQDFIPTATETGAISDITWWVLEEICKNIYRLKEKKVWRLSYISINIDAKQLLINHFVDKFLETLSQYHIKTGEIMIEITEQSLIDNFEGTQDIISVLKDHGINCAIDDFGIGYSSLSYLKKLSFDTLKIDREFIKDIQQRPDDITLIKTMLTIGREFNYNIVIEGIEDNVQKETLAKIDPKLTYQGFLFEKPIAFEAFIKKYVRAEPL